MICKLSCLFDKSRDVKKKKKDNNNNNLVLGEFKGAVLPPFPGKQQFSVFPRALSSH